MQVWAITPCFCNTSLEKFNGTHEQRKQRRAVSIQMACIAKKKMHDWIEVTGKC